MNTVDWSWLELTFQVFLRDWFAFDWAWSSPFTENRENVSSLIPSSESLHPNNILYIYIFISFLEVVWLFNALPEIRLTIHIYIYINIHASKTWIVFWRLPPLSSSAHQPYSRGSIFFAFTNRNHLKIGNLHVEPRKSPEFFPVHAFRTCRSMLPGSSGSSWTQMLIQCPHLLECHTLAASKNCGAA